tara:strand:- start:612 stop:1190 length:579 start_codon:yes stop_codon:yes gene_type:complete
MAKILDLNDKKSCEVFVKDVKNGAVFAYPTEAVFGLGCDIKNKYSIRKILEIKQRDVSKGLIVISDNLEKVRNLIDDNYYKIFVEQNSDAKPTTWLCPASDLVLEEVTGNSKKIAIRITTHKTSCDICKLLDFPIISTSANKSGDDPIVKSSEFDNYFHNFIDYIVDGKIGDSKKPSRILDLITKEVLRAGD